MKKVLIINGHQPYPFAEGRLNATLAALATSHFEAWGYEVQVTEVARGWDVEVEIGRHQWADVVFVQHPVNWMGVPWVFKKYMDEVYTAGMDGRLCVGDGRHGPDEAHLYGLGGALTGADYMLSLTFNAPADAFENPEAPFFASRTVDDLMWPTHLNMQFFGLSPLPTFSAHDVMKNPSIESDLDRFRAHLATHFSPQATKR